MTSLATHLQPVDWETIDSGLYDWLVELLGVTVIWANQNVPQPDYPYLTLHRNSMVILGGVPEKRYTTDLGQPAGKEIEIEATSMLEFTLGIQAFVDAGAGANDPMCNAVALLNKARASLGMLSWQRTFQDTLGLAIVEPLAVIDVSEVVNDEWISRAALDIRLRTRSVMTEQTGFTDKVTIKSTQLGVDFTVDAS
jgi:hypothetical protein